MNRHRVVSGMSDETQKIVINTRYGGFNLSSAAEDRMDDLGVDAGCIDRDDDILIRVVEELGVEAASGCYCELQIVEIPSDVDWVIQERDGREWVAEKHRTWD